MTPGGFDATGLADRHATPCGPRETEWRNWMMTGDMGQATIRGMDGPADVVRPAIRIEGTSPWGEW